MMDMKRLNEAMMDLYLPEHIKNHMRLLGVPKERTDEIIKDVMSNPEKKEQYMKVIEEYSKEEER